MELLIGVLYVLYLPVDHGVNSAFAIWRNHAEVGDATNILTDAPLGRMMNEKAIDERHQRCALPTNSLFGHAEISHRRDSGDGTDDRPFTETKCRARLVLFRHG